MRSVERCIDILDLLAVSSRALNLSEISRGVAAPKSTVLTILRTLVGRRVVGIDEGRKRYALGLGVVRWAGGAPRVDLASLARAHLQHLARETQETATLALTDGRFVYYLERTVGDQLLQYVVPVGMARPMHGTAGGKVFLAHMGEAERLVYIRQVGLKRFTDRTVTDPATLERQLKMVRRAGYAITRAETSAQLFGIAAPIVDPTGKVISAVNLGGPLFRLRGRQDAYVASVIAAAKAISAEITRLGNVTLPQSLSVEKEQRDAAE